MNLYRTMHHLGGFKEALVTQVDIDPGLAEYLIKKGIYKKYSYDERLKAERYIFKEMAKNWQVPTWLLKLDEKQTINEMREKFKKLKGESK